jgi:hypothetical protein
LREGSNPEITGYLLDIKTANLFPMKAGQRPKLFDTPGVGKAVHVKSKGLAPPCQSTFFEANSNTAGENIGAVAAPANSSRAKRLPIATPIQDMRC